MLIQTSNILKFKTKIMVISNNSRIIQSKMKIMVFSDIHGQRFALPRISSKQGNARLNLFHIFYLHIYFISTLPLASLLPLVGTHVGFPINSRKLLVRLQILHHHLMINPIFWKRMCVRHFSRHNLFQIVLTVLVLSVNETPITIILKWIFFF